MVKLNKKSIFNKTHHSTGDWNFDCTDWWLDSTHYVSAPSSLTKNGPVQALIKTTTIPISNVKEGRIATYVYASDRNYFLIIIFRYQNSTNYYYVKIFFGYEPEAIFEIHRIYGGVDKTLISTSNTGFNHSTWYKVRVTWWNDYVGLVIRFEYLSGSTWVLGCSDAYDANNYWKDIGGRVGIYIYWVNVDNTEIYGIGE